LICLLALYFIGAEQGATSLFPGIMSTNSSTTAGTFSDFPATKLRRLREEVAEGASDTARELGASALADVERLLSTT
jgi:hypothetical protein